MNTTTSIINENSVVIASNVIRSRGQIEKIGPQIRKVMLNDTSFDLKNIPAKNYSHVKPLYSVGTDASYSDCFSDPSEELSFKAHTAVAVNGRISNSENMVPTYSVSNIVKDAKDITDDEQSTNIYIDLLSSIGSNPILGSNFATIYDGSIPVFANTIASMILRENSGEQTFSSLYDENKFDDALNFIEGELQENKFVAITKGFSSKILTKAVQKYAPMIYEKNPDINAKRVATNVLEKGDILRDITTLNSTSLISSIENNSFLTERYNYHLDFLKNNLESFVYKPNSNPNPIKIEYFKNQFSDIEKLRLLKSINIEMNGDRNKEPYVQRIADRTAKKQNRLKIFEFKREVRSSLPIESRRHEVSFKVRD